MPPQILIQDVEQFQTLQNFGGDIGESSMAEWYALLGPHLFHFKLLGLLAVSLDNGNAVVVWCQLSK